MIEVHGYSYSLIPLPHSKIWSEGPNCNAIYFSPWTGHVWARADFGCKEWFSNRLPAADEPFYMSDYVNGSLFVNGESWILDALPKELLLREVSLMIDLRSDPRPWYNYPTYKMEPAPMSPELMSMIALMRTKVLDGTIKDEDLRSALRAMRADRVTASRNSDTRRAATAPIDPDKALDAIFR